tara:strand:+ start:1845 stop:2255 length:411 start_codon:yes stop_codon:yes gene_type:complete
MNLTSILKDIRKEQKEWDAHAEEMRTQNRINKALANRKLNKKALTERLKALADSQPTTQKKKKTGIDMALRSKVGIEYGYVGTDKRIIADPNVLEENKSTSRRKMTEKEFFAQEIKRPKNSLDNQVVDIKAILNNG